MTEVYVASFKYGSANLSKAQVVKETTKSFMIAPKPEKILGWQWLPKRLSKKSGRVYLNPGEALDYLVREAEQYLVGCRKNVESAVEEHDKLVALRKEVAKQAISEEEPEQ